MAEEPAKDQGNVESAEKKEVVVKKKKKQRGVLSRIWNGIFRIHGDDFEKRLQYITKEEAAVLARLKRRSQSRRRILRNLTWFSALAEVIAISYAIMTTRTLDLDWKMRALRVFPMFLLPALYFLSHSTLVSLMTMSGDDLSGDRKDQKTVERLREERQAKIEELKERTNYYTTQQLIQRYDPDPAAKAAATTVLASKLGADSGLKVYLGDENTMDSAAKRSNDAEHMQSTGLRQRKQGHNKSHGTGGAVFQSTEGDLTSQAGIEGQNTPPFMQPPTVEHFQPQGPPNPGDGGWIAKLAALLVGEDPTQSYALICGNCHMHNGLARKEDFPYITYYCPHCHALNKSKLSPDSISEITSPNSAQAISLGSDVGNKLMSTLSDPTPTVSNPISPISEIEEVNEIRNEASS